jgi:hypothetical protein
VAKLFFLAQWLASLALTGGIDPGSLPCNFTLCPDLHIVTQEAGDGVSALECARVLGGEGASSEGHSVMATAFLAFTSRRPCVVQSSVVRLGISPFLAL